MHRRRVQAQSAVTADCDNQFENIALFLNNSDIEDEDEGSNVRPGGRSDRLYRRGVGEALNLPFNVPEREKMRKFHYEKYTKVFRPQEALYISSRTRYSILLIVLLLSLATRLYRITQPTSIVFDEVHFGKFAAYYLKGEFFFDVHPPLGKLMLAGVAYVMGWDGRDFKFDKIHKEIPDNVPYTSMRVSNALQGAVLPVIAYLTLHNMGYSVVGASLAAGMVLCENMFVTQTRFIFLDPPLMLFIALTVYTSVKLDNYRAHAFSKYWTLWLALTGLCLGLAVSVKWIGLFIIAFVGVQTLHQLWTVLTDRKISVRMFTKHFIYRVVFLIMLPVTVYVLIYAYHLRVLTINGPGSGFMSKEFRDGLFTVVKSGNSTFIPSGTHLRIENNPAVSPRMFMQSPNALYLGEDTSHQQQVSWVDDVKSDMNLWFVIKHVKHDHENDTSMDVIYSGDKVCIEHVLTQKGLFVHGFPAPVSGSNDTGRLEVSANEGHGHTWRIDIEGEKPKPRKMDKFKVDRKSKPVLIKGSKYRLLHEITGCVLSMSDQKLPKWGLNAGEVLCAPPIPMESEATYLQTFVIDDFVREPGNDINLKKPTKNRGGLWTTIKDVWAIQRIAWEANMRLTGSHPYESRPHTWPTMISGVSYWQDRKKWTQIYLLGNPSIFYLCLVGPAAYILCVFIWAVRRKRGYVDMDGERERRFLMAGFLWMGWALHYIPFYFMHRQLFFHHYMPAHYFMILAFSAFTDTLLGLFRNPRVRMIVVSLFLCVFAWYFKVYSSLVYGNRDRDLKNHKIIKTWNFL